MTVTGDAHGPRPPAADIDDFRAARAADWVELARLADQRTRSANDTVRLSRLHRATVADLAHARRRWPGDTVVGALEATVARSHAALYAPAGPTRATAARLATGSAKRAVAEVRCRIPHVLIAAAFLVGAAAAAAAWVSIDETAGGRLVPVDVRRGIEAGEWRFPVGVLAALAGFAGGLLGGVGAVVVLAWVGAVAGASASLAFDAGHGGDAVGLLLVAAPLLSAVASSAGIGIAAGWPLPRPGQVRWSARLADAAVALAVVAPMIVVGGVLVQSAPASPSIASMAIGAVVTVAWWAAVVRLGGATQPRD